MLRSAVALVALLYVLGKADALECRITLSGDGDVSTPDCPAPTWTANLTCNGPIPKDVTASFWYQGGDTLFHHNSDRTPLGQSVQFEVDASGKAAVATYTTTEGLHLAPGHYTASVDTSASNDGTVPALSATATFNVDVLCLHLGSARASSAAASAAHHHLSLPGLVHGAHHADAHGGDSQQGGDPQKDAQGGDSQKDAHSGNPHDAIRAALHGGGGSQGDPSADTHGGGSQDTQGGDPNAASSGGDPHKGQHSGLLGALHGGGQGDPSANSQGGGGPGDPSANSQGGNAVPALTAAAGGSATLNGTVAAGVNGTVDPGAAAAGVAALTATPAPTPTTPAPTTTTPAPTTSTPAPTTTTPAPTTTTPAPTTTTVAIPPQLVLLTNTTVSNTTITNSTSLITTTMVNTTTVGGITNTTTVTVNGTLVP